MLSVYEAMIALLVYEALRGVGRNRVPSARGSLPGPDGGVRGER
jgi:hypothetical protein